MPGFGSVRKQVEEPCLSQGFGSVRNQVEEPGLSQGKGYVRNLSVRSPVQAGQIRGGAHIAPERISLILAPVPIIKNR
jgi:hypothetical protein